MFDRHGCRLLNGRSRLHDGGGGQTVVVRRAWPAMALLRRRRLLVAEGERLPHSSQNDYGVLVQCAGVCARVNARVMVLGLVRKVVNANVIGALRS